MKFTDVFGVKFGVRGNLTKYPDSTSNKFDIEFTTPNHDESDVRFTYPTMGFVFNKSLIMQIVDNDNDEVLYEHNRSFSMFINDSGIDPKSGKQSGHRYVTIPARPYHLKRNHSYTLRVHDPRGFDPRTPIGIMYQSLDVDSAELEKIITIDGVEGVWVPVELN